MRIQPLVGTLTLLAWLTLALPDARGSEPFFPKTHPLPNNSKPMQKSEPLQPQTGLASLVGTWKRQGEERLLWSIRKNGLFRVHGVFLGRPYRGKMQQVSENTYRIVTPVFEDQISARLEGNVMKTDGRLGPATWLPVWRPGDAVSMGAVEGGACNVLPVDAVASILQAPLHPPTARSHGGSPREAKEGCHYKSILGRDDRVKVILLGGEFGFRKAERDTRERFPITNVGDTAFAALGNGIFTAHVLHGSHHLRVELEFSPDATPEDLPELVKLAALATERFQSRWIR